MKFPYPAVNVNSPQATPMPTHASPRIRADSPAEDFESGPDYVQSLARGLQVIRAFGPGRPRMSLSEVAASTGTARAVARRLLLTLEHLGYVARDGRQFSLAPRVLELGYSYLSAGGLPELARPAMEALSRRIHESVSVAVLDDTEIVYVQRVAVNKVMTITLAVGARLPAFCTSMGRVLLAALPADELQDRLARSALTRLTPHTCTDPRAIARRIATVRREGHAYTEQELEPGLCSLAVPLHDAAGQVVAALNAGMAFHPQARERALGEVLPALHAAAREIEAAAGMVQPGRRGGASPARD